jgi:WhiB family redox-sensing transcriptional regulator
MKLEIEGPPHEPRDEVWKVRAKCANFDVNEFFPGDGVTISHIREFCSTCPVARECVDYAVKYVLDHGVWGGTSPKERRAIRMGRMENPYATVRR